MWRTIKKTANIVQGKILTSLFSFVLFLIITKLFSIEDVGNYLFLLSMTSIIALIGNWGTNEYLFRELAISPLRTRELLALSQVTKLVSGLLLGFLVALILFLWREQTASYIFTFVVLLASAIIDAQTISCIMVYRAQGNTEIESWFFPIRAALRVVAIFPLFWAFRNLNIVLLGSLIIYLLSFIYIRRMLFNSMATQEPVFSHGQIFGLLRESTPYALAAFAGAFYLQVDSVIIGSLGSQIDVAMYGIAYNFLQVSSILPVGIGIVIQPSLVKLYDASQERWSKSIRIIYSLLILGSLLLSLVIFFAIPEILHISFGNKYESSIPVMRILVISYFFSAMWSSVIMVAYVSSREASAIKWVLLSAVIVVVVCNFYFFSEFGIKGTALIRALGDFIIFIIGSVWLVRKARMMTVAKYV